MSDRFAALLLVMGFFVVSTGAACRKKADTDKPRVSGQVEATEVHVSSEVGGRILEVPVAEGSRVKRGDLIAQLDTRDI